MNLGLQHGQFRVKLFLHRHGGLASHLQHASFVLDGLCDLVRAPVVQAREPLDHVHDGRRGTPHSFP